MYNLTEEQQEELQELEKQLLSLDSEEMEEIIINLQRKLFIANNELKIINAQREQMMRMMLSQN